MTKKVLLTLALLCCSVGAFAWDCPTGQIRQQAPSGTSTSTPNYDVVEGIAFICVPSTPTPTPSTSNNTSSSTSGATATSGSTSNSGASATGGNSSSNSGVSNSGNSSNTNKNTLTSTVTGGNQNQSQKQSNSSTNNNASSATENGNNSNDSTTNIAATKIPVSTAYAPTSIPSAPCVKGFGAGVQTFPIGGSFGGSKIDSGCDAREDARSYALLGSRLAACKILVAEKKSRKAGVTLADCLTLPEPNVIIKTVTVEKIVNVPVPTPAPTVVIYPPTTIDVHGGQTVKPVAKKVIHKARPCVVPDSLKTQKPAEKQFFGEK